MTKSGVPGPTKMSPCEVQVRHMRRNMACLDPAKSAIVSPRAWTFQKQKSSLHEEILSSGDAGRPRSAKGAL